MIQFRIRSMITYVAILAVSFLVVPAILSAQGAGSRGPSNVKAEIRPRTSRGALPLRTEITWQYNPALAPNLQAYEVQWSPDGINDWQSVQQNSQSYHRGTYRVSVRDGRLNIAIIDRPRHPSGVKDANAILNGCEITDVSNPSRAKRYDFGPNANFVQQGFAPVTPETLYRRGGYGFRYGKAPAGASDRPKTRLPSQDPSGTNLMRDLVWGPEMEFVVDVPNGQYDVTVAMGDTDYLHDHMMIQMEGRTVEADLTVKKLAPTSPATNKRTSLIDLKTYRKRYYRVRAILKTGQPTAWSDVGCVTNTRVSRASLVSARAEENGLRLRWPLNYEARQGMYSHRVFRKRADEKEWRLVAEIAPIPAITDWVDEQVQPGEAYEYRFERLEAATGRVVDTSLLFAGREYPGDFDLRGTAVLVIDRKVARSLRPEITRFEQDLIGDGWRVRQLEVDRHLDLFNWERPPAYPQSVRKVRNQIRAVHKRQGDVRAVILIGHVPIPYSGTKVSLDGHMSRTEGSWIADSYYGDLDGEDGVDWTDNSESRYKGTEKIRFYSPSHNAPGDGKFDQDSLMADRNPLSDMKRLPEAFVGRIDMAHMDAFRSGRTFTLKDEIRLLRQYFAKNHRFRMGIIDVKRQALLRDDFYGSGSIKYWRGLSTLFGNENLHGGEWFLSDQFPISLFGFVGTYGVIVNNEYVDPPLGVGLVHVARTEDLARVGDTRCVFTAMYGSYIANWDSQDNFMRAALADEGPTLVTFFSSAGGFLHFMGLGKPVGYGQWLALRAMEHGHVRQFRMDTWVSVLGDPTLRLHSVKPPQAFRARRQEGKIALSWRPPKNEPLVGFHLYQKIGNQDFERITDSPIRGNTHLVDGKAGTTFMVRGVKLETSGSGSYYNASEGMFARIRN